MRKESEMAVHGRKGWIGPRIRAFLLEERGIGTIEVVIIIVVMVALGFAFRNVLTGWYNHLVGGVESQIYNGPPTSPYGL